MYLNKNVSYNNGINNYTHRVSRIGIFRGRDFQFELVEAAHVCYMGDGDMFKMEDVGDEKANSWNAMCIHLKDFSNEAVIFFEPSLGSRRFPLYSAIRGFFTDNGTNTRD